MKLSLIIAFIIMPIILSLIIAYTSWEEIICAVLIILAIIVSYIITKEYNK